MYTTATLGSLPCLRIIILLCTVHDKPINHFVHLERSVYCLISLFHSTNRYAALSQNHTLADISADARVFVGTNRGMSCPIYSIGQYCGKEFRSRDHRSSIVVSDSVVHTSSRTQRSHSSSGIQSSNGHTTPPNKYHPTSSDRQSTRAIPFPQEWLRLRRFGRGVSGKRGI